MLIAEEKKKNNIVEYVLYMFQIEDIIRSFRFQIELVDNYIVQQYSQSASVKEEIRKWYKSLIFSMREQGIEEKGHLDFLKDNIRKLNDLHKHVIAGIQDKEYIKLYEVARPELEALVMKSGGKGIENEMEIALNGVYGLLVLRLKKQEVNAQTEESLKKITKLLASLVVFYKKQESGQLVLPKEKRN